MRNPYFQLNREMCTACFGAITSPSVVKPTCVAPRQKGGCSQFPFCAFIYEKKKPSLLVNFIATELEGPNDL